MRIIGDVTIPGQLETLREVDEIFINGLKEDGLYDQIWQVSAVLLFGVRRGLYRIGK